MKLQGLEAGSSHYLLDYEVTAGKPRAAYRHIGIYGYRVKTLRQFVSFSLKAKISKEEGRDENYEHIERLEQLRALDQSLRIHCPVTDLVIPHGVDTEQDLTQIINAIEQRNNTTDA